MAAKGNKNGAPPSATVAPNNSGSEQGQGGESTPANVLSASTASEALPDNDKKNPDALTRDDVAVLFDIPPAIVLSFREYDDRIVVVTTAGAKMELAK